MNYCASETQSKTAARKRMTKINNQNQIPEEMK
jgi:hypothetical protein